MKQVATIISRVFEPYIVALTLAVIGALHGGLQGGTLATYLLFFLLGAMLPVFVFRVWLMKKKRLTWDIHERKKRIKPLLALIAFVLLDYVLIAQWHNTVLSQLFLIFLVWVIGFFVVTLFWKISGHAGTIALATGLIISWFGWGWWPVILTVPLVAWARVVRRDHTILQVIAGALYSWVLLVVFDYWIITSFL